MKVEKALWLKTGSENLIDGETLTEELPYTSPNLDELHLNRCLPILKNWRFRRQQVIGRVFGHPKFTNGTWVITSQVISLLEDRLRTRFRTYQLEKSGDRYHFRSKRRRWRQR